MNARRSATLRVLRPLRPVLIAAGAAAAVIPITNATMGATAGTVATALFVVAVFVWSAPRAYPHGQLRFSANIPARVAYRRAGCKDWTVSAGLYRHGISPARVRTLLDRGITQSALFQVATALNEADHPDGPFIADVLEAMGERDTDRGLEPLLDLPPDQRGDAVAYAAVHELRLQDIADLCKIGIPVGLGARVAASGMKALVAFEQLWVNPVVHDAFSVGSGGRPTDPARLAEHLNEWIDAVPSVAWDRIPNHSNAAPMIARYGTTPLAGWWFAAGYSPDEAAAVAAERDWSLGQLAALAALRQGPPVFTDPAV